MDNSGACFLGLDDFSSGPHDYWSHCVFCDLQDQEKTSTVLFCPEHFEE